MMRRILDFIKSNRGAILAGIFVGTSYIPFPPWALLFCYVPLWLEVLQTTSVKKVFVKGWLTQLTLTLIGFHWIAHVSHEFGFLPWPVAIFILVAFAAFFHLYIPLAVTLAQLLRRRFALPPLTAFLVMAGFTSLGEIFWPSLFPWNLGYSFLWIHSPIAQIADKIGFWGLSFFILLINALLAWSIHNKKRKTLSFSVAGIAAALLILHLTGLHLQKQWQTGSEKLQILQVQANIGNLERYMAERGEGFQDYIIQQYFSLTREGLKKYPQADLIVWPESAFPDYLNPTELYRENPAKLNHFVQEIKKPLLTGSYSRQSDGDNSPKDYNAMFLYDENMQATGFYHKTNLLVFGEYTPFSDEFPFLTKISPAGTGFHRGRGPKVFPFKNYQVGPQICYESLYPLFSTELSRLGADFVVNLTNDSWFGATFEPYQHMVMTLARAIEIRRPLLRATNTGVTTAILADGSMLAQSPIYQPWFGLFEIQFQKNAEQTFYTRFGKWLPLFISLFLLSVIFLGRLYASKRK
jgi:apolipoprotein N-acyltransferase